MTEDFEKVVQGDCPDCGPSRMADVKGEHTDDWSNDEVGIWGRTDFRILVCRGCARAYFQKESIFSEDVDHREAPDGEWESYIPSKFDHFPSPSKRTPPKWQFDIHIFDRTLGDLLSDVYRCFDANLIVPTAIATRTAFDRATELLSINPALTFNEKLDELVKLGKISTDERSTLEVLVDAGSAAAHRGWHPTPPQLDTLASLLESFLHRAFVLGIAAQELRAEVPPKPTRSRNRGS